MHRNTVILLGVLIAVCLLGLILGLYFGLRTSDDAKSNDIFHDSFSASFDIDTIERRELGSKRVYLKVEWNHSKKQINFEQTEVISSNFGFDFRQFFILADDKAVVGFSNLNSSMAFCVENIPLSQWFGVFQHIVEVDNWISGSSLDSCLGNIWSTKQNDNTIAICIHDNRLQYVTYQNSRATSTSWAKTFKNDINITADVMNGPCPNVSPVALSCSDVENQPKFKRDTGVSPATCLFVHGTGENPPANDVLGDLSDYWGNVKMYTSNCVSHKFLHYNSKSSGWDVYNTHQHFCDVAAPNGTISNTVIFSHSMGNLVIAAALHRKKCTFDSNTSRWFSVQGPWKGSITTNTLASICRNPNFYESAFRSLLRWYGYCKPTEDVEFEVYTTLKTNYVSSTGIRFEDLLNVGKKYVSGVMCGTSSTGQWEDVFESLKLLAIQFYASLGNPNDGMVAFDSCKLKTDVRYETGASYPYYKGKFNHADGTCRNGGCPCKWYEHMH